jgi:hypothetical protein
MKCISSPLLFKIITENQISYWSTTRRAIYLLIIYNDCNIENCLNTTTSAIASPLFYSRNGYRCPENVRVFHF